MFKKSKEGRVGLAYLQPYPQTGGYQAPEEDKDAEAPVNGDDAFAREDSTDDGACYWLGFHHHGVMEILGQEFCINETGTYVGEGDVLSLDVCQLRESFEVCVAITLGGRVGGGCSHAFGAGNGGNSGYVSVSLLGKIMPNVVYQASETHGVCLYRGEFYDGVKLAVLLANATDVQIYVHATKAFYEFL